MEKNRPTTPGAVIKANGNVMPAAGKDLPPQRRSELQAYGERYGSFSQFFRKFSTSLQPACAEHPERCYLNDTPTLIDLRDLYGRKETCTWVKTHITYVCNILGHAFSGGSDTALTSYATHLMSTYTWLKASEWMLFFSRLAAGQYGRIYGDITPDYMTDALRQFLRQRNGEIDHYERQMRQKQDNEPRREGAVSYDTYRRMLEGGFLGDPHFRDIHCNTTCVHFRNGTCVYDHFEQCPRYHHNNNDNT